MTTLVQGVQRMSQLQKQIKENKPITEEEKETNRKIDEQIKKMREAYNAQNWIIDGKKWELDKTEEVKKSVDDQTSAVNRTVEAVGALAARWFDVSTAITEATTKVGGLASGETMTAASGGTAWQFLAGGGNPRGTDVIPAFLSEGERIVNAESARRFASQLTAINAGIKPVFRSEGGSVTNIGDINVTVSGGGSSHQTARSIAAELKRELRRGTSTL